MSNNDLRRPGYTNGYDNNKIAVRVIFGLVALGAIWYAVDHYVLYPTPAVQTSTPISEPTGQGPGTPGRP